MSNKMYKFLPILPDALAGEAAQLLGPQDSEALDALLPWSPTLPLTCAFFLLQSKIAQSSSDCRVGTILRLCFFSCSHIIRHVSLSYTLYS